jgi:hypothetical protein
MNSGKTVFRQLIQFLARHDLNLCVRRYRREYAIHKQVAFFVVRAKENLKFNRRLTAQTLTTVRNHLYACTVGKIDERWI